MTTVARYALERIRDLGVDHIFGVPGDYAFAIDDAVEKVGGLHWIGCSNELNAAYAADGYARIRGVGLLTTTYGVGELSALNGVFGSKAHRVPVFHLVGMPSERIRYLGLPTHHNIGDQNFDRFQVISGAAACVTAVLTPENCVDEMERVIREALRNSMPAYIVISQVHGVMPVLGTPVKGVPLEKVKRQVSMPNELDAAVASILARLSAAKKPLGVMTALVARYGVRGLANEFVQKANLPTAVMPSDKGSCDENIPQFMGLLNGRASSSPELTTAFNEADLILDIGGYHNIELNTGFWSFTVDKSKVISIYDNYVRVGSKIFLQCAIDDVLQKLVDKVAPLPGQNSIRVSQLALVGAPGDETTSANFYPRLQHRLKAGDTLVIETGTCMFHLNRMLIPKDVGTEGQGLWGSIGWATPACFGVNMAKKSGRTWMVTGDGSHQMTYGELAVMGRYNAKPAIFVINNDIYGVEDVISERGHPYDDLAKVEYRLLPAAFGCKGWLVEQVSTVGELDAVLDKLEKHDGAAYIVVKIPETESQPMPKDQIDQGYRLETPKADQ